VRKLQATEFPWRARDLLVEFDLKRTNAIRIPTWLLALDCAR
jgi:hypothetical protein